MEPYQAERLLDRHRHQPVLPAEHRPEVGDEVAVVAVAVREVEAAELPGDAEQRVVDGHPEPPRPAEFAHLVVDRPEPERRRHHVADAGQGVPAHVAGDVRGDVVVAREQRPGVAVELLVNRRGAGVPPARVVLVHGFEVVEQANESRLAVVGYLAGVERPRVLPAEGGTHLPEAAAADLAFRVARRVGVERDDREGDEQRPLARREVERTHRLVLGEGVAREEARLLAVLSAESRHERAEPSLLVYHRTLASRGRAVKPYARLSTSAPRRSPRTRRP
ncbi:hypothetical protein [Halosegnis marinus]|uniref:hypothetical protein n=1 Tax=Halosegnis marinus TaxID=3034023 RepID=UPI00360DF31F